MTPQEKAKELTTKFYQLRAHETMNPAERKAAWMLSKDCARLLCKEIVDTLFLYKGCYDWEDIQKGDHDFYKDILLAIDNL